MNFYNLPDFSLNLECCCSMAWDLIWFTSDLLVFPGSEEFPHACFSFLFRPNFSKKQATRINLRYLVRNVVSCVVNVSTPRKGDSSSTSLPAISKIRQIINPFERISDPKGRPVENSVIDSTMTFANYPPFPLSLPRQSVPLLNG